jgi:hypothetical protein
MRKAFAIALLAVTASVFSPADSSLTTKRDHALEGIKACLRRNEVLSRECKHLNQDVATLVEVYRGGDKSVLPTLFEFTYLTDFYDEALLSDPEGFLTAMAQLPKKKQQAVAAGIAGGCPLKAPDASRSNSLRTMLRSVSDNSPNKAVAALSLKTVEDKNASLFVSYFSPGTFTSRAANFMTCWYSSAMHQLGETPLWPPSSDNEKTYRFTYLGAFTGTKAVALTVLPDGKGQIKMTSLQNSHDKAKSEQTLTVSNDRVSEFLTKLDQAHFWEMPTESQHRGFDGAEWIMEGVQSGTYHIAVRWCPDSYKPSPQDAAFAAAARFLLQLSGDKHIGGCGSFSASCQLMKHLDFTHCSAKRRRDGASLCYGLFS